MIHLKGSQEFMDILGIMFILPKKVIPKPTTLVSNSDQGSGKHVLYEFICIYVYFQALSNNYFHMGILYNFNIKMNASPKKNWIPLSQIRCVEECQVHYVII